jgi:hypothetical protein
MELTQLEKDILAWISDHFPMPELAEQIRCAECSKREYTGHGYFVDLQVPAEAPLVHGMLNPHNGPAIESPELEAGAVTLLYNTDGRISCLEIAACGDVFPEVMGQYSLDWGV